MFVLKKKRNRINFDVFIYLQLVKWFQLNYYDDKKDQLIVQLRFYLGYYNV